MSGIATAAVGDQLPGLSVRLTRTDLVRYAGASTDFNPIHHSEYYASKVGLPGVVAHGMLTMGLAVRVVTQWAGDPARVLSCSTKFTKPVVVPDGPEGAVVEFSATVTAVADGVATVSVEAVCDGQKVLGAARAQVALIAAAPAPAPALTTAPPDPVQPDPVQPDPVQPDPVQSDPVQPDPDGPGSPT